MYVHRRPSSDAMLPMSDNVIAISGIGEKCVSAVALGKDGGDGGEEVALIIGRIDAGAVCGEERAGTEVKFVNGD